jgi:DNA-3-methyladenine glycosylase II
MVTHRTHVSRAIKHVAATSPHLGVYVQASDRCNLTPSEPSVGAYFDSLVRSVVAQQISSAAAASVYARLRKVLGGRVTPRVVLARTPQALQAAGLSKSKVRTIRELAKAQVSGEIDLRELGESPDDVVVAELSQIWGIGRWTAEMFMMFTLGRLDVWPVGDLAVRRGWQLAHGLSDMPTEKELDLLGAPFRPYRSVAAWYCWRVLEPEEKW